MIKLIINKMVIALLSISCLRESHVYDVTETKRKKQSEREREREREREKEREWSSASFVKYNKMKMALCPHPELSLWKRDYTLHHVHVSFSLLIRSLVHFKSPCDLLTSFIVHSASTFCVFI